jgi:serine/threonine protein kinase
VSSIITSVVHITTVYALKYTIKRPISSGSFGTIYEILNEEDNKIYALKELTNKDIVSKERFERENRQQSIWNLISEIKTLPN